MKLSDWLDEVQGRQAEMAAHFDVTPSAVSQWRDRVPVQRIWAIHGYTSGAVSIEEMLPEAPRAKAEA